jgi:hypothetical protein
LKDREQNNKIRVLKLKYEYKETANDILGNQSETTVNFKEIIIIIIIIKLIEKNIKVKIMQNRKMQTTSTARQHPTEQKNNQVNFSMLSDE